MCYAQSELNFQDSYLIAGSAAPHDVLEDELRPPQVDLGRRLVLAQQVDAGEADQLLRGPQREAVLLRHFESLYGAAPQLPDGGGGAVQGLQVGQLLQLEAVRIG